MSKMMSRISNLRQMQEFKTELEKKEKAVVPEKKEPVFDKRDPDIEVVEEVVDKPISDEREPYVGHKKEEIEVVRNNYVEEEKVVEEVEVPRKENWRYVDSSLVDMSSTNLPISKNLVDHVSLVTSENFSGTSFLKDLGLEGKDEVKVLRPSKSNIKPLEIKEVKDVTGRISSILTDIQELMSIRVVPSKITKIGKHVIPKDHDFFDHGGERYYYNKVDIDGEIETKCKKIEERLLSGELVKEPLFENFVFEGNNYWTFKYSPNEIQDLYTLFTNYGSKIVDSGDGEVYLVVGDYLYE